MKIAIVSLLLPSGSKIGVGYVVHHFANHLVERGHEVTVFSQTGAMADSLYTVQVVPSGDRLRTFGFAWNLRRCDFSQFDVLNAHGDDWFLWGLPLPRHIHTYHGSLFAEMLHAKTLTARLRMGALALCEYSSCYLADELVTVSENTRAYIPMVKRVIPNGVDLTEFRPGEKNRSPAVLFVGTMGGRKRGAMLLELFHEKIRPALPECEFWAVCEDQIAQENGVTWFGRVDANQLAGLYRKAWVFCLPSTYEGFGVPYIEAMASGTAVVATSNPGAIEVTCHGASGIIAEDTRLSDQILNVLRNRELRENLESAGLKRAQDFGWDAVCASYEKLFAQSEMRKTMVAA
jgi:glycosyltransferase involved in cell wall biosynthesis